MNVVKRHKLPVINKSWGYNVQYEQTIVNNTVLCISKFLRVNFFKFYFIFKLYITVLVLPSKSKF